LKLFLTLVLGGICLFSPAKKALVKSHSIATEPSSTELFRNDEILEIKLSGPLRDLFDDRKETPTYYSLVISYMEKDSSEVSIPIKARTRGHFRRLKANCDYPPILLNFEKSKNKLGLFENQNKIKLVTPCQSESYIFREWLVYKMYNLLTPESLRARLVRIQCYDTKKKKELPSFYGILLEDSKTMAKRNNMIEVERRMPAEYTDKESYLQMAMFQYMIGNCDWSVRYLHNTKLIATDSFNIPHIVPYDFDHAGIVDAHYAYPPEELGLRSTKERRYRGYCFSDTKVLNKVIATFKRHKNEFYKLYNNCPYLTTRYIRSTTKFLDDFYETLNNSKQITAEISIPCQTGYVDIIVKGLKEE
jgi:hypothetical protein